MSKFNRERRQKNRCIQQKNVEFALRYNAVDVLVHKKSSIYGMANDTKLNSPGDRTKC